MIAVAQTCSVKKLFLKTSENSQGNTCARASFLMYNYKREPNFLAIYSQKFLT